MFIKKLRSFAQETQPGHNLHIFIFIDYSTLDLGLYKNRYENPFWCNYIFSDIIIYSLVQL